MRRTKIAIIGAWIFAVFALLAHFAAMVALVTDKIVFGIDFTTWLFISISEAVISVIAYLDHFAHRGGALTGKPNE